jgi:hypothetical protein
LPSNERVDEPGHGVQLRFHVDHDRVLTAGGGGDGTDAGNSGRHGIHAEQLDEIVDRRR